MMQNAKAFADFVKNIKIEHCIDEQLRLLKNEVFYNRLGENCILNRNELKASLLTILDFLLTDTKDEKHILEFTPLLLLKTLCKENALDWHSLLSTQKIALHKFLPCFFNNVQDITLAIQEINRVYSLIYHSLLETYQALHNSEHARLIESEEKYKDLFDNANDLIQIVDPQGRIIYVNNAWIKSLGYSLDEIKGRDIYSLVADQDRERFVAYRQSVLTGVVNDDHIRVSLKNRQGKNIIVEGFISCKFINGVQIYTRGIFRDITSWVEDDLKLKSFNEQLIEREENLQQLLQHAPDAIIVIDEYSNIIFWNPKSEEIFGWTFEEVAGRPLAETIIPSYYRQAHADGMKRYLKTGEVRVLNKTIEITALNKKGSEFYVSLTISQSRQAGKTVFISFIRDITQQKKDAIELEKKRKELEESNSELEQYAWVTSHDLKEPLRKVLTYSDIILTRYKNNLPVEIESSCIKINDSAKRMNNLIQSILLYSSISKEKIIFSQTDLTDIVSEVVNDLEILINENHARIDVAPLPSIEAVPFQMQQLFQNIISNSIKYRKPQHIPVISIAAEELDGKVVVTITDNGIGIDEEDEEKIFQLFFRLNNTKATEGSGVGLALSKKIVQNHKGTIHLKSKPGEGTIFFITLPVKQS
ncbi:MAG: PAS domain S-box protein [Chitinophagaceae bacterium]